ncbi:MAG: DUF2384 domain-containing protein [Ahrensia sp.]|nr:DUF2384 domain-containing protein [Ahrensia sp.]
MQKSVTGEPRAQHADGHRQMLAKIRSGAVRAFGERAGASWMQRESRLFDGRTPEDMANSDVDAERVLTFVSQLVAAEDALKHAGIRHGEH